MELGMEENELGFRCVRSQHRQAEGALRSGGPKRRRSGQFCSSLWSMELGMAENDLGFRCVRSQHLQAEGALRSRGPKRRRSGAVLQLSVDNGARNGRESAGISLRSEPTSAS